MNKSLKYPIGCKISWCGEEFEVLENYDDYCGVVRQENEVICNFHFSYQGEDALIISK